MNSKELKFLQEAINLAKKGMESNSGGPFGAIVVDEAGTIIGRGYNQVTATKDPTAHAEIVAIRQACKKINSFQLTGCTIFASCEPCPMCLGAIYWARPDKLIYANTREDAALIGFDDQFIYDEINVQYSKRKIITQNALRDKGWEVMKEWRVKNDREDY
ncbi:nucleoside deaminase [Membranihabitans maritimus]|uniref:nucleoside deaminase n=1 Tax=Membranihabitans maritimus TaxID=2904244 RepID=UPI001F2FE17B|nr:nucleoside deaminase [Membranihabitans maritimus]